MSENESGSDDEMVTPPEEYWKETQALQPKRFVCGHCGSDVTCNIGYAAPDTGRLIYICHNCIKPTYFGTADERCPGDQYGANVEHVNDENVAALYREARGSFSAGAYTAAVLCCRKLLMNIAVAKGADKGTNFVEYVQFLGDQHYVPPDAIGWVDEIRKRGNEATHEIAVMARDDAANLIDFCSMLLKVIFEFPGKVKNRSQPSE